MPLPDSNTEMRIFIGIIGMLVLLTGFLISLIYSQRKQSQHRLEVQQLKESQQNQLIESAVRSEEMERHRIAEQLHDEVGAILSATKLHFLGIKTDQLSERDLQLHAKTKELLDEGIQKVRNISHNLHSNILKEFGLNEAIAHFAKKTTSGGLINLTVSLDENYVNKSAEDDISAYRLFQELLNNILKHANPTDISVATNFINNVLSISIVHNGTGITQDQFETLRFSTAGLGLRNIQNRLILLKGRIHFDNTPDGYRIVFQIPKNNTRL
jgi:two-component system, NarL family, sensor kinase